MINLYMGGGGTGGPSYFAQLQLPTTTYGGRGYTPNLSFAVQYFQVRSKQRTNNKVKLTNILLGFE